MQENIILRFKNKFKVFDENKAEFIESGKNNYEEFYEKQKEYFQLCPNSFRGDGVYGDIYIVEKISFHGEGQNLKEVISGVTKIFEIPDLAGSCLNQKSGTNGSSYKQKYISFLILKDCSFIGQTLPILELHGFIIYFTNCEFRSGLDIISNGSKIINIQGTSSLTFMNCEFGVGSEERLICYKNFDALKNIYLNIINPFIRYNEVARIPTVNLAGVQHVFFNMLFTDDYIYQRQQKSQSLIGRKFGNNLDISCERGSNNSISIINNKALLISIKYMSLSECIYISNSKIHELHLGGNIKKLESVGSKYNTISLKKCYFEKVPFFSNDCSVNQSVFIDGETLHSIERIGKELEYLQLSDFFSRSRAYIEAQKFHKYYLLAKAKKETQLKFLVPFYNYINGCGTSFRKPFNILFILFIINFIIYFCNEVHFDKVTSCKYYFNIFALAINNTFPFLKLFLTSGRLNIFCAILANISAAISTLILFLIALQIRKLLKIKE